MKKIAFTIIIAATFILTFLPTPVSAAITSLTPLSTFTGEAVSNYFGNSVSSAGDVNGDGYDDVIVSAHRRNAGLGDNQGSVYIFYGGSSMDNSPDVTMNGVAAGDRFGNSVSSAGDVNNDGYDDVVVGAYLRNAGLGANQGSAYIFYGGSSMDNSPDVTMDGEAAGDYFGQSVSQAGDVNGDGYDDVIVGAYYQGATDVGRAYIFYGGSSMDNNADVTFTGEAASDRFGCSASSAGDVNNDGFSDVIVGAWGHNAGLGAFQGSAYIFYGGPSMDNVVDVTMNGVAAEDLFGWSVSSAGDINNDGFSDVIVGAYYRNAGLGAGQGSSYIFYGGPSMDNTEDVTIDGEAAGDSFGWSVSSANDINNDGYSDVVIGAPYHNAGLGAQQGRAYIYFGGSSMDNVADVTMDGEAAGDQLGCSVSSVGDVNNDGWKEFIVGASNYSSSTGRAYLYNLNYASPSVSVDAIGSLQVTSTEVTGTATQSGVNVGGVQVRIDGGEWMTCNADDGAFDEESEEFNCPLSGLEGGEHTVEVRSYDENGVYIPSSLYATDTFTVDLPETGSNTYYLVLFGMIMIIVLTKNLKLKTKSYN
jgi:hypothetical protein